MTGASKETRYALVIVVLSIFCPTGLAFQAGRNHLSIGVRTTSSPMRSFGRHDVKRRGHPIHAPKRHPSLSMKQQGGNDASDTWWNRITDDPSRSVSFSVLMALCGAMLGPFLDAYHSTFGVLQYDEPITAVLWGSVEHPALITAWWVPELFGVAGFLIGWLYILLDSIFKTPDAATRPSVPKMLMGISIFTLQYWLSGELVASGSVDRTTILNIMSVLAAVGFYIFDGTLAGIVTSAATALGGPLIEVGLISIFANGLLSGGYHYTDLGETGFFPLWIAPVYFLGGPANGNLARGFWNLLSEKEVEEATAKETVEMEPCEVCNDTRQVPCPNCDGIGAYVAMGGRTISCTSCRGRGFVICRTCFDRYDEDPYDIESIRDVISRRPD